MGEPRTEEAAGALFSGVMVNRTQARFFCGSVKKSVAFGDYTKHIAGFT